MSRRRQALAQRVNAAWMSFAERSLANDLDEGLTVNNVTVDGVTVNAPGVSTETEVSDASV